MNQGIVSEKSFCNIEVGSDIMPGSICNQKCENCEGNNICKCFITRGYGLQCNNCDECLEEGFDEKLQFG